MGLFAESRSVMAADDKNEPRIRFGPGQRIGRVTSFSWTWEKPRTNANRPNPFPTLGTVGGVLAIFLSYSIAVRIVGNATILLLYGWHAYFDQGLRPGEWKRHEAPLLSNGAPLHWAGTLMVLFGPPLVTVALALGLEFAASRVRAFLGRQWLWVTVAAQLILGLALIALSLWPNSPRGTFEFPHHLGGLAAFVAGCVLIWKAVAASFRRPA